MPHTIEFRVWTLVSKNKVGKQTTKEAFLFVSVTLNFLFMNELSALDLQNFLWEAAPQITDLKSKNFREKRQMNISQWRKIGYCGMGGRRPRRTSVWKNIPPTSCIFCCPLFVLPIRLSYEVLSIKNIKASFQKYFIDYSHMSLLPRPWLFCSIPMHNIICFLSESNSPSV